MNLWNKFHPKAGPLLGQEKLLPILYCLPLPILLLNLPNLVKLSIPNPMSVEAIPSLLLEMVPPSLNPMFTTVQFPLLLLLPPP